MTKPEELPRTAVNPSDGLTMPRQTRGSNTTETQSANHAATADTEAEEPVVTVGVVQFNDPRDIETIEREFGGTRQHVRNADFDLFGSPSGASAVGINSQSQPAMDPERSLFRPDPNL